jgi:hypothetical protein
MPSHEALRVRAAADLWPSTGAAAETAALALVRALCWRRRRGRQGRMVGAHGGPLLLLRHDTACERRLDAGHWSYGAASRRSSSGAGGVCALRLLFGWRELPAGSTVRRVPAEPRLSFTPTVVRPPEVPGWLSSGSAGSSISGSGASTSGSLECQPSRMRVGTGHCCFAVSVRTILRAGAR